MNSPEAPLCWPAQRGDKASGADNILCTDNNHLAVISIWKGNIALSNLPFIFRNSGTYLVVITCLPHGTSQRTQTFFCKVINWNKSLLRTFESAWQCSCPSTDLSADLWWWKENWQHEGQWARETRSQHKHHSCTLTFRGKKIRVMNCCNCLIVSTEVGRLSWRSLVLTFISKPDAL